MGCIAPSALSWRNQVEDWSETHLTDEFNRAWSRTKGKLTLQGPPYDWGHHDWTNFRTATLREARRRGLDISITGLSS